MRIIFLFLVAIGCNSGKKRFAKENDSNLFEIAMNICPEVKNYYHFETEGRKTINILVGKNSSLTHSIKCFGYMANIDKKYQDDNSTWIEVWNYKKISTNEFYILYKIKNEETFIETTIQKSNGQWAAKECKITASKSDAKGI